MEAQQNAVAQQKSSLAKQRASVRRQLQATQPSPSGPPAGADDFFELPDRLAVTPPAFDCPPAEPLILNRAVEDAAAAYKVPVNLISAVIRQESGGYPCAVSAQGAQGLMQLMPATADQYGVTDPFDTVQNISAGTRLLSELIERYSGDLNRVLGAYNAGPAAVDSAGGVPPFPETLQYVRSIMSQIKPPPNPKLISGNVR